MSITLMYGVHPKFGGALITKSIYNQDFVRLVKERIHWQNRVWWKEDKTWLFNPHCSEAVWRICKEVFGGGGIRLNNRLFPKYECPEYLESTLLSDLPPWLGGNVVGAVKAYHEAQGTKMWEEIEEKPVHKKGRLIDL